jgi:hypothetical protein
MSASHVAVPLSTAKRALIAVRAWRSELDLHYEVAKLTPGTARFHLGDMCETAARDEQAMKLAVLGAEGETLREVCGPLIAESEGLVRRDYTGTTEAEQAAAEVRLLACLAGLRLALSASEGGIAR